MFRNWEMGILEYNGNIAKVLNKFGFKHQCIVLKEGRFFPVGGSKRGYLIYSRGVRWESRACGFLRKWLRH